MGTGVLPGLRWRESLASNMAQSAPLRLITRQLTTLAAFVVRLTFRSWVATLVARGRRS